MEKKEEKKGTLTQWGNGDGKFSSIR